MIKINRKNGFHESYYDHACLVVTEHDVLDIDVKGMGSYSTFQRRWYDLFLLSHSDERAGDYYHSTHAMRMARMSHFRRHRQSIHPLSKFRNFWDMFILLVLILHQILIYLSTSVLLQNIHILICYIAMLLEMFIILDIFINARTGYVDRFSRKIELDGSLVLRNYCSKRLFFHTASAIPLATIMFIRYGNNITCTICKTNYFNCAISFLTIINIFRVFELSSYWSRDRLTFKVTVACHILRIGVNITLVCIQFLHYSDIISLIRVMETRQLSAPTYNDSFFDSLFSLLHIDRANFTDFVYLNAHFWRVVNFLGRPSFGTIRSSTSNYAIIYPHPFLKFLAYGLIIISMCWMLVEIFAFITRQKYIDEEIHRSQHYLSNLVQTRQLSEQFRLEINDYFDLTATKMTVMEMKNGLYKCLPKVLKDEIAWQCFSRLILRIPCFSDWPKEVIEKMVALVTEDVHLANDVIAEVGEPARGLTIVDTGMLAVYSLQEKEVEHLIDGDYFGELSLVTDGEIGTSSIVAVTKCKILLLEKILFRQLMRSYPDLFYSLRNELMKQFQPHDHRDLIIEKLNESAS